MFFHFGSNEVDHSIGPIPRLDLSGSIFRTYTCHLERRDQIGVCLLLFFFLFSNDYSTRDFDFLDS